LINNIIKMYKTLTILLAIFCFQSIHSQKRLVSWSQQNIENYNQDMFDAAQRLTPAELLEKNINDEYWSEVFLTLNASLNNYTKEADYKIELAEQITNKKETKLKGTGRLIIWERIVTGDILFEGKGLVMDNDLFTVAGRANQILQSLTHKDFGSVTITTTSAELEKLKIKWLDYISGKPVEEYKHIDTSKGRIPEICSLDAAHALIISLQDSAEKDVLTKKCLKDIYNLEEMPSDKKLPANYCNPDTYTYGYLGMLFGDDKKDTAKDAKWWLKFWNDNNKKLIWNTEKGIYQVKK